MLCSRLLRPGPGPDGRLLPGPGRALLAAQPRQSTAASIFAAKVAARLNRRRSSIPSWRTCWRLCAASPPCTRPPSPEGSGGVDLCRSSKDREHPSRHHDFARPPRASPTTGPSDRESTMSDCEEHRPNLAALPDGETELVPAGTLTHVFDCHGCVEQVQTHRLPAVHLRASVNEDQVSVRQRTGRRWPLRAGTAAAVVVALAGAAAGWHVYSGEDRVAAAVGADQPQYGSDDTSSIKSWCERASGRLQRS